MGGAQAALAASCKLTQNANEGCNSCASLAGLVLSFIACFILLVIGVGAQSTLGGHKIFARKICIKISKIPEFYMIFARKIPEFYIIIARKIFFQNFRGHVPPPAPRLLRLCYL